MHPEFNRARDGGEISRSYYAPQVLSSSYIVRRMHALYNDERVRAGLEPIYYKLATDNPRNPVNLADDHERDLIRLFNADRSLRERREILTLDGKQVLQYSMPFLETNNACLQCHGRREDAPAGLAMLYPELGGFGETAGRIRAVESVRVPIQNQLQLAWTLSGAGSIGLVFFFGLVFFNGRLRSRVRDRTRTLRAEVGERQRAQEEIHRLKDSLSAVIDAMPSVLVCLDGEGRVTLWNRQAELTTGVPPARAVGRPVGEVLPELAPDLEELRADEASATGPVSREKVSVEKDGRRHFYDVLHYPFSAHGMRGGVLRIEDVTGRVHMETHLAQAQKLEAIGTLAGGIAHDFNNILSAIVGYTDLALSGSLEPELREDLQAVREAARRATELTRQILTFSRQSTQQPRSVQPAAIAREALKLLRASIPTTIEIHASTECDATVVADPADLHSVVVNLCTNAALAMTAGGVLDVVVDAFDADAVFVASHPECSAGRHVRLTVRDTGAGMTPEVRARIFEPFFTMRQEEGGTGLGLATVHGIVHRLGGAISVASEPGRGSTFQVFLPVRSPELGSGPDREPEGRPGSERVLFIDDETAVCRLAERSLGRLGYRVTAFSSPAEALAAFEAQPASFDVVVTDMTMPGLTGDAVAQRVKQRRPELPVILCTGYSERVTPERASALGIDLFVMKPIVGAQLSGVIRAVLERGSRL